MLTALLIIGAVAVLFFGALPFLNWRILRQPRQSRADRRALRIMSGLSR